MVDQIKQFENHLFLCLKAEFPLVFVVTQEEHRAFLYIEKAANRLKKKMISPRVRGEISTVQTLLQKTEDNDVIIVLDDVHRSFTDSACIRLLADNVWQIRKKSIVIVAPFVDLPQELERISAVLEMPLPSEDELVVVLNTVFRETDTALPDIESQEAYTRVAKGMTQTEAYLAYKKALMGWPNDLESSLHSIILDKQIALKRSRVLENIAVPTELDDVGGLDRLKEWLVSRKVAFSDKAKNFGLTAPRGLLLMGVQGCGKSLTAKAIAGAWHLPLVRLDISLLFGEAKPEASLNRAFRITEAMAPLVLWIDELEKGFDEKSDGQTSRVLGGLVTWLQEKQKEVFVVATANRVENLPPELPRKGRFDDIFFVDLPGVEERKEILGIHLRKHRRRPEDFDLDRLAAQSDHFNGSELEQIVISGLFSAFARGEDLTEADLEYAIRDTIPLYDTFEEEIKSLREWARKRARPASTDRSRIALFK